MNQSVYFVQAGANGPIKIGYSGDVTKRLSAIQTGNHERLSLLYSFEHAEAPRIERELHAHFSMFRLDGEWFRPDSSVFDLIDALKVMDCDPNDRVFGDAFNAIQRTSVSTGLSLIVGIEPKNTSLFLLEWSPSQKVFHIGTLTECLWTQHLSLLFGWRGPSDFVMVAICTSYDEALAASEAIGPRIRAMDAAKTIRGIR